MPPASHHTSKVAMRGTEGTAKKKTESSSKKRCQPEAGPSPREVNDTDSEDSKPTLKRRRTNGKPTDSLNSAARETASKSGKNGEVGGVEFSSDEGASEDEDNDDRMFSSAVQRKKKFYVVENDGRPAELYRTDYIHRLRTGEDIDADEPDDNGGILRLNDRWREEWNHGVQVPLNAKQLPQFITAPNSFPDYRSNVEFRMPKKYINVKPCGSDSEGGSELQELPRKRLYQGDRLDELWLGRMNQSRRISEFCEITMKVFLELMNCFEITCYEAIHQMLLAPLNSPDGRDDGEDDAPCDICRKSDPEDDEMIFCDGCNVCVHLSCYGLPDLPHGDWYCQKCEVCGPEINPPCLLCPTVGGAYKTTAKIDKTFRWAHISCALWLPECRFEDIERREPVTAIDEIPDERWQLKCSICDTRQGACIQCSVPTCRTPFHVSCAFRSDLEMRIEQDPDPGVDTVLFISLCQKHRTADSSELVASTSLTADVSSDDKENAKVRSYENHFYLYVDPEEVYEKFNHSFGLHEVSDVYEYWKLKRSDNQGRSLIRNPQDEILLNQEMSLVLPSCSSTTALSKWKNSIGRLRESLDMGRLLADQNLKLCRTQRDLTAQDVAIIDNIWSQSIQLTVGQRVNDGLIFALKGVHVCDADEIEPDTGKWIDSLSNGQSHSVSRESTPASSRKKAASTPKHQSKREVTPLISQSDVSPGPSLRSGRSLDMGLSPTKENIRSKVVTPPSPERVRESIENRPRDADYATSRPRRSKLEMKSIENVTKSVRFGRRLSSGTEKDAAQLLTHRSPVRTPALDLASKRSKTVLRRSSRLSI